MHGLHEISENSMSNSGDPNSNKFLCGSEVRIVGCHPGGLSSTLDEVCFFFFKNVFFDCEIYLASHSICYVTEFDRLSKCDNFTIFQLLSVNFMFLIVIQNTMKHFKSILIIITIFFAKRYDSSP